MYRIRVYLHSILPFEVPVNTSLVGQLQTAENCRSVSAFPYTKNHEKRGMKVETKEVPSRLRKGLGRGSDSGVRDLPRSKKALQLAWDLTRSRRPWARFCSKKFSKYTKNYHGSFVCTCVVHGQLFKNLVYVVPFVSDRN